MSGTSPSDAGDLRCGTVALVGWTNVGKSTLLNRLVGDKLAAVADVAQTTRFRITGVRHVPGRGQVVFIDTPGLHRPRSRMNRRMVETAWGAIVGVDLVLVLIDASRGLGEGDERLLDRVKQCGTPAIVALNKVDLMRRKSTLLPMMEAVHRRCEAKAIVPICATGGDGCDELLETILDLLPSGPPIFADDEWTDQPLRRIASEWIREKLLRLTRQELPHSTAVLIDRWDEGDGRLVRIDATILVDRASQKPIVIGRGGLLLKEVGTESRHELEALLERKVALTLWVKVREGWRDDDGTLREIGVE